MMPKTLEQLQAELLVINNDIKDIDYQIKILQKKKQKSSEASALIENDILKFRKNDLSYVLFNANAVEELRYLLPNGLQTIGYYLGNEKTEQGDLIKEQRVIISISKKDDISDEMIEFIENKWLPVSKACVMPIDFYEDDGYSVLFQDGECEIEDDGFKGSLREVLEYIVDNYPSIEPDYDADLGISK